MMINLTFASFRQNKDQKDQKDAKQGITKKHELPHTSFKHLYQLKDRGSLGHKLDNQQNNVSNTQQIGNNGNVSRKNMVKVNTEKSKKKYAQKNYKSPSHKPWEPLTLQQFKPQQSLFATQKHTVTRQEENMMTPSLNKNTKSVLEDAFSASYMTQKHSLNSDHGSISSNKNSFNDSFHLGNTNMSLDESDYVNSSVQLLKDSSKGPTTAIGEFPLGQGELLTNMKKSTQFFYNNEVNTEGSVLKELETQTNRSATNSVYSIKFSEKFKHHKKRQSKPIQLARQKKQPSLQDFKRIQEIGEGKYGKVYLARHIKTNFICALKTVSKKMIHQQNIQNPFIHEIKIQFYLNHPNIVQLYSIFHDKENVYLVMEYCSGGHLFKLIKQKRRFEEKEIMRVLSNVFQAVSYIHCNGVIHRDIKPENIVVQNGMYKLCDFGWAAYACGDTRTTFCGTPLYVCPEVLKGEQYNEKADIWGLGIVTYELTFGRVPFAILNQSDLMKIIKDPVYFPVWGQISEKLVEMVRKMLSKDAIDRPSLNQILASELFSSFRDSPDPLIKQELCKFY